MTTPQPPPPPPLLLLLMMFMMNNIMRKEREARGKRLSDNKKRELETIMIYQQVAHHDYKSSVGEAATAAAPAA